MRVLISGGTGLVGRQLGLRLARAGHQCVVLARDPVRAKPLLPFRADIVGWDPLSGPPPAQAFEGVDAVVNLLGEPVSGRWTESRKKQILESRVLGTRHLVAGLRAQSTVKVLVSASAVGLYGDRGDQELDERSEHGTDFLAQVCAAWEAEAVAAAPQVRTVVMRVGVVLAAMGGALDQMLPLFRAGVGGKLGSGRQWMSWIHLQDLVSLVVHAIQTPSLSGPINAVAPHPLRNADFSKALARAVGKSALLPAPGFALKLALGEMSQMILGGQRVRPAQALESGFVFQFPTLEDALGDLAPGDEVFESLQWIPKKVEEVFPFFSEAKNLETLTPELLQFKIVAQSTPEIQEGTLIDYQLKVHGIPMHWRTRIEEWKPGVQFVDTQLKGPYSRWHHNHRFESLQGGTLLSDRVLYRLPGGGMGSLMAGSKVRSDVRQIFEYRREKIEKLFGRI